MSGGNVRGGRPGGECPGGKSPVTDPNMIHGHMRELGELTTLITFNIGRSINNNNDSNIAISSLMGGRFST